jgi:hypothetical protein
MSSPSPLNQPVNDRHFDGSLHVVADEAAYDE